MADDRTMDDIEAAAEARGAAPEEVARDPDLPIREVARQLSVSTKTVMKLIHAGKLRAFKIGEARNAMWRVTTSDLEAFRRSRISTRA